MSLWTDDDSDALDAQVKALRQADKRSRTGGQSILTGDDYKKIHAADPGLPNIRPMHGRVTRRAPEPNTSLPNPAEPPRPPAERKARKRPKPRPTRTGRWLAVVNVDMRRYSKTFDTEPEAEKWIDQMKESANGTT